MEWFGLVGIYSFRAGEVLTRCNLTISVDISILAVMSWLEPGCFALSCFILFLVVGIMNESKWLIVKSYPIHVSCYREVIYIHFLSFQS